MYMTSLVDVYEAVAEKSGEEIKLEDHVITQARKQIDKMIEMIQVRIKRVFDPEEASPSCWDATYRA